MQVFVAQNGKTSGPYTQRQIRRRYDQGKLRPDDHIWYEGVADWMPAAWIENWADFRKASHRQRDAVAFLGGTSPPGILTLEAEELIATLARESGREDELQRWYLRYDKFAELAEWWANRSGDIGVPGGHGVLQVALQEVHDTDPELFQRITPMDVLARVDHFRRADASKF